MAHNYGLLYLKLNGEPSREQYTINYGSLLWSLKFKGELSSNGSKRLLMIENSSVTSKA